jgi:flagellar secretion chaperone FliS
MHDTSYGALGALGQMEVLKQYRERQLLGASPAEGVVLLYDGALRFVAQAKEAIGRGDIQGRHNANARAIAIVSYLMEILNPEQGGEVALRLMGIYAFLLKRLVRVDFENSQAICDEVRGHLQTLKTSWDAIAAQEREKRVVAAQAPASDVAVAASLDLDGPVRRSATA